MGDIYCIVGTDFRDGLGKSQSQGAARETGRSSEGVVAVQKRGKIPGVFGFADGFSVKGELEGGHLRNLKAQRREGPSP